MSIISKSASYENSSRSRDLAAIGETVSDCHHLYPSVCDMKKFQSVQQSPACAKGADGFEIVGNDIPNVPERQKLTNGKTFMNRGAEDSDWRFVKYRAASGYSVTRDFER